MKKKIDFSKLAYVKVKKRPHYHILWQPNGFLDSSILQCETCQLTFIWDITKQKYIEVK